MGYRETSAGRGGETLTRKESATRPLHWRRGETEVQRKDFDGVSGSTSPSTTTTPSSSTGTRHDDPVDSAERALGAVITREGKSGNGVGRKGLENLDLDPRPETTDLLEDLESEVS